MRKISVTLLIAVLGVSCFGALMGQALAQSTTPTTSPPPLIIRWMRYHGAITQWGSESYKGSVTINAKTANVPPALFKPWVTVNAFWSNEPPFPATKPIGGQYSFTHYAARLVKLTSIEKQETMKVVVNGLWNVHKVKITTDFDEKGVPIKVVREVTSLLEEPAEGKLQITSDWKKFSIEIKGVEALQGVQIRMMTTTSKMSPFSYAGGAAPSLKDLMTVVGCFRAMPGFGNFIPELDYNQDSKIDIADLTTVAANM